MKNILLLLAFSLGLICIQAPLLHAQDGSALPSDKEAEAKKVHFNGLGRTIIQQTELGGAIMDNNPEKVDRVTDGEFLLDLAINATPNEKSEVQAILRLRNEFGGFFGAGQSIEVRELWARGIIADIVRYRVGDMDMVMTPFTLFNPDEEGMVNNPSIFQPQKDLIYYEQFYAEGNQRRLQGAKVDMGLNFSKGLKSADVMAFISRIRGADFFTTPTRFVGGGSVDLLSNTFNDSLGLKADLGLNLAYTWDDLTVGEANSGIRNAVTTIDFDVTILEQSKMGLHLRGEVGRSNLNVLEEDSISVYKIDDTFLEVGAALELKPQHLTLSVSYVDVGPDFFSIGAQSKRIGFDRPKSYFNRVGADNMVRMPGLFDISRDRAMYTFQLSDRLMNYDPRLSNTSPYGRATPNRQGLRFGLDWKPADERIEASVTGAVLNEIRGQGTNELKSFNLIRAMANVNFDKMIDWKNKLRLTLGYQYENTSRSGLEVEKVDLNSNLLEIGLEAELFANFELLAGGTFLTSNGRDYIPLIETFNVVKDFPDPFVSDDTEALLGAGLRYNFKKDTYVTFQYQNYSFARKTDPNNDYTLSQVFVLYTMNF